MTSSNALAADSDPTQEVATLLSIPGAERVLLGRHGEATREICKPSTEGLPQAERWLPLLSGMAARMSDDIGLGAPQIVVTIHAEHLLVLGISAQASVGVIGGDPGAVGLAIVRTRQWLEGLEPEGEPA